VAALVFNFFISNTTTICASRFSTRGRRVGRLSPAYDMNPVPTDISRGILSTAINEATTRHPSLSPLRSRSIFELDAGQARDR